MGSAFVQSQPVNRTAKQQVRWTRSPDAAALTSVRFTNDLSASRAGADRPPIGTCLLYFAVSRRKKKQMPPQFTIQPHGCAERRRTAATTVPKSETTAFNQAADFAHAVYCADFKTSLLLNCA